jgi:hypothetical protein
MRPVSRMMAAIIAGGLSWSAAPLSHAGTITDLSLSSYTTGTWGSNQVNGTAIAGTATSGNAGSGITFGDFNGNYVEIGPDATTNTSPLTITFASSVALNNDAVVNTLINLFFGQPAVDATITFKNSSSAQAQFSLVGNQTVRDYNNGNYVNGLSGSNTNPSDGQVTAQTWSNYTGSGTSRLDAQTFVLPSSWGGTSLVSMTISNPYTATNTNDVVLSAVQVNDQTAAVPEPMSLALLLVGMGGAAAATATRRRSRSRLAR